MGAYQSIFVSRSVNRCNLLQSEIPFQLWFDKRSHKAATSRINVNDCVHILLNQKVIDSLGIFVLAGIGASEDGTNSNLESQLSQQLLRSLYQTHLKSLMNKIRDPQYSHPPVQQLALDL